MEVKEWFHAQRKITTNYSDFSFQVDLPCQRISRTLVQPRGAFEITGIALLVGKKDGRYGYQVSILDSDLPVYRPIRDPEVFIIPHTTLFHPAHGIDLSRYSPGDVKLGFSIDAFQEGAKLILWHEVVVGA